MSEWDPMADMLADGPPDDEPWFPAEPESEPTVIEATAGLRGQDGPLAQAARASLDTAVARVEKITDELEAARHAVADAHGDVAVAVAKRDDYLAATEKPGWMRLAAQEAVATAERLAERRTKKMGRLEDSLARAQRAVAEATAALLAARAVEAETPLDEAAPGEPPKPYFHNVYAFFEGFLAHVYARDLHAQDTERSWCPLWWEHAEATARLEALWKAFEALRLDPGVGASVWWRDHADPTMRVLLSPTGPFARCTEGHELLPRLPAVRPADKLLALGTESTSSQTP